MAALENTPEARFSAYDSHFELFKMTKDDSHLRSMFSLIDLDGDGHVSKSEVLQYYQSHDSDYQAELFTKAVMAIGDTNKDGFLDEREFVAFARELATFEPQEVTPSTPELAAGLVELDRIFSHYQTTHDPKYLETMFHTMDLNRDGFITHTEFRESVFCRGFKSQEFAARFLMAIGDENQDGVLSIAEFVELMQRCLSMG